ncbi:MAG: autotransporter outer membrane beta-barrel domain-containing protein [Prosthecobacter sp.]
MLNTTPPPASAAFPSPRISHAGLRPCQRGWRQRLWAGTLALFLMGQAQADIIIQGQEVGGNVVFTYAGSMDLTGLPAPGSPASFGQLSPSGRIAFADFAFTTWDGWDFAPFDLNFGPGVGPDARPTTFTGDTFAVLAQFGIIGVPVGYVSGTPLAGTMTFAGETFASMGIDPTTDKTRTLTPFFDIRLFFNVGPPPEQLSAVVSGLPFANAQGQMLINAGQTVTSDVNNHLFKLMAGDGEADAANDDGVIVGQGDGPGDPVATRVSSSRPWEVFTTANFGAADLSAVGDNAGVRVESWAPSVGAERYVARGLAIGAALSFLTSEQEYTNGLGSLELEGPAVSAYLTFARRNFWNSLLYSFGSYELDTVRNPGFGFGPAFGSTRTHTNSVQYNTGWNLRFADNTFITGPFAGIDYLHGSVDGYGETGGGAAALGYGKQTYESLIVRVGWAASKKLRTNWAEITPQVRLAYERQNLANNGTSVSLLNAPFTVNGGSQSPGRDYVVAGAGVQFAFNDQLSLLLNYQGQFFRDDMSAHFGSVQLGWKF